MTRAEAHRDQFWMILCCWLLSYVHAPAWGWLTLLGICGATWALGRYCEYLERKLVAFQADGEAK